MSMLIRELATLTKEIKNEVSKVVVGGENIVELLLITLLSGEHALMEGPPGSAKTLTAKSFAKATGLVFRRFQMTVETMPTDITGFYVYTLRGDRIFRKGPIFSNIFLIDELNRAPPRTQSALIEAMQERQVTIEGDTYRLPMPFVILATQMPYGAVGTYALPEVVLDRFAIKIDTSYLDPEGEKEVIMRTDVIEDFPINSIASASIVVGFMREIRNVKVDEDVARYIVNLVNFTRFHDAVEIGPSTRAAVHLFKLCRAYAAIHGRDYVIPDDVKVLASFVMGHRIKIKSQQELEGLTAMDVVSEALKSVKVPK